MLKAAVLCSLLALISASQTVRSSPIVRAVPVNSEFGIVCPDKTRCPRGFSCVKPPGWGYSCCPFRQGVSCGDGSHCCPDQHQCSEDGTSCSKTSESVAPERVEAVICPDGESECPAHTTCCLLPDGNWGCCPKVKAVCCADRKHCCPEGTTCDLEHYTCVSPSREPVPMLEKLPARRRAAWRDREDSLNITSIACPDGRSRCPDSSTCCQMTSGLYGCCPYPDALCCSDHLHCCPGSTTCDLEHMTCVSGERPPVEVRALAPLRSVQCEDQQTECPDETTCCKMADGTYGCCPMPKAVCCADHIHCCPEGTTCDEAHSMCVDAGRNTTWATKIPAVPVLPVESAGHNVPCNDSVACAQGSTCCKTLSGEWACCPLPKAVCCEDHLHCCPSGTVCNLAASTCDDPRGSAPWLEKVPAFARSPAQTPNDECDPTTSCPGEATCCKTATGEWACCPLPKAVCCTDHLHCCPENTVCNLAAATCDDPSGVSTPWLEKVPALVPAVSETPESETDAPLTAEDENVPCDDTHACPSGSTCCKTEEGEWACCPLPKAVCCTDHLHCCPENTVCNLAAATCDDPSGVSTPWLEKVPALAPAVSETPESETGEDKNVQCDDTHACPSGSTCCKTEGGEWACCPLPKAVCCTDHLHCCPENTVCNLAAATCDDPSGVSTPWLEKVPAVSETPEREENALLTTEDENVPCDDTHACPSGSSCCKTEEGEWACCPLPKAVCCQDHLHCCPEGTVCNLAASTCDDPRGSAPWLEKVPALSRLPAGEKCDDEMVCPSGTTCCRQDTGDWACCPLPHAVCCDDREHCCPKGYKCDVSERTCVRPGGLSLPWARKRLPLRVPGSSSSSSPNSSSSSSSLGSHSPCPKTKCPRDTTCCYMEKAAKWGCCPLPNAVCCDDGDHCCPKDYKCDAARTSCKKGKLVIPWYRKEGTPDAALSITPETNPEPTSAVTPQPNPEGDELYCDEQFRCPKTETCCRTSATSWACCPSPKASCCPDMTHCCPAGYSCDPADGSCTKQDNFSWDSFFGAGK